MTSDLEKLKKLFALNACRGTQSEMTSLARMVSSGFANPDGTIRPPYNESGYIAKKRDFKKFEKDLEVHKKELAARAPILNEWLETVKKIDERPECDQDLLIIRGTWFHECESCGGTECPTLLVLSKDEIVYAALEDTHFKHTHIPKDVDLLKAVLEKLEFNVKVKNDC